MSNCPNCGKPVDQLRSRNVSVRAGKVVAYCSPECQAAQETKPTAVPRKLATVESGPVIEITHEPASGVVTSAPDRRDASAPVVSSPSSSASGVSKKKAKRNSEPIIPVAEPTPPSKKLPRAASEPRDEWAKNAELIAKDAGSTSIKPRRGLITAILVLVVAGAAAFVAYKVIFVKKATSATDPTTKTEPVPKAVTPEPVAKAPEPEKPAPTPGITIPEALDKAKVAIAKSLRADSPRVQRLAAAALERGGDRAASELLAAALKNETSDVARLELAYALARGGDQRGINALNQAFASSSKDTQRWAAERIVRLSIGTDTKSDKAIEVLAASLDVPQNRLISGELLGRVGDPRGLKALDAIRADATATADAKAQAAIALGLSGRAAIGPTLHDLLANANQRPAAAAALAHLEDTSAKEVLVEQLGVVTQRVRAARALRELDPKLDPLPLVAPLLAFVATAKDADQVEAGEAILILCGPAAWSTHD